MDGTDDEVTASSRRRLLTQRPTNAYAHYEKLVHDLDRLEDDLAQSRLAQQQLESQLERHADAVAAHALAERNQELDTWARERERRVEEICVHHTAVQEIHRQQVQLEDEELRLEAELHVLQERQQQANETDAKRVYDLIHTRTSLLENELTKGQLDLAFLTQAVATNRRKHHQPELEKATQGIHAVVDTIRRRREAAFREATAQFQQRLRSFERVKQELQRKTDELQWKKQRALQVLSTNQQQVITGFFTTPRAAIQDSANPAIPTLEFAAILEGMRQPTGETVGRLQELEYGRATERRRLDEALAEATRNVENGPKRLAAIEKNLTDSQQDALRLKAISPSSPATAAWTIETYRRDQYELVYFLRSLIFDWMAMAVDISSRQPATQLLEAELRRFGATRRVLQTLDEYAQLARCGLEIAQEIHDEVVAEMAASIYDELLSSADRVRVIIQKEIKDTLFSPQPVQQQQTGKQTPAKSIDTTLRWTMFGAAWREICHQRMLDASHIRRLPRLLMRPAETVGAGKDKPTLLAQPPEGTAAASPTKRRAGFFGGGSTKPAAAESKAVEHPPEQQFVSRDSSNLASDEPIRIQLVTQVEEAPAQDRADTHHAKRKTGWDLHHVASFSSLPTCGFVTCLQLSPDAQLMAIGTLDGEVVVFSVAPNDEMSSPIAVRVSPPDKSTTGRSAVGTTRITRLVFSYCGRLLLSYNQLKVVTLWTLARAPSGSLHSPDCFSMEILKGKPPLLVMVIPALAPVELFAEPPVPADVLERDAPVAAARLRAAPVMTVSSFQFFPSVSLTGEPTHLLCGASTGDLLKLSIPSRAKPEPARPKWLLGPSTKAGGDTPTETMASCDREFFRQGHRSATVLFVNPIASLSGDTRLISVDHRGGVALWTYRRASWSGFGWFVPHATYQLDLAFPGGTVGEMLQIQLTSDRKTLVLMVYGKGAATGGRLRFVQLDLSTEDVAVKPVRIETDLVGEIPPRFALIDGKRRREKVASCLVLLMDNALRVFSLNTGELSQPVMPLHHQSKESNARPKKASGLLFNSISASHSSSSDVAVVAVAGEQHREIRIYRFTLSASSAPPRVARAWPAATTRQSLGGPGTTPG